MWQRFLTVFIFASGIWLTGCDSTDPQQTARSSQGGWFSSQGQENPSTGQRVALIIGNGAYQDANWPKLRNPINDAQATAEALRVLGFSVTKKIDLTNAEMRDALAEFGRQANGAALAWLFFAGHGVQDDNQNYLMPVDVTARSRADIVNQGISLNLALDELENAGSKINIVMLDACRDNPYGRFRGSRSGLSAPTKVPGSTILVYSTQPGNIAADRLGGGQNSPFTDALVAALQGQDLRLGEVLKITSLKVEKATSRRQIPYVNGPRTLDDVLLAATATVPKKVPEAAPDQHVDLNAQIQAEQRHLETLRRQRQQEEAKLRLAELKRQQAAEAARLEALRKQRERKPFEPETVAIPAGSFMMGSPDSEAERSSDEGPVHRVKVAAFAMGKYEVTNAQFRAFRPSHDSGSYAGQSLNGDNQPVVQVIWQDAVDYTKWLSQQTGKQYRLPSEAEWEYAARAGTSTARYWGNDPAQACNYANVHDETAKSQFSWGDGHACTDGYAVTAPVGQFTANGFGLHDMLGNVWEWTQDRWHNSYTGAPADGSAWQEGYSSSRSLRGCSWYGFPDYCRSAYRFSPVNSLSFGFRVAVVFR